MPGRSVKGFGHCRAGNRLSPGEKQTAPRVSGHTFLFNREKAYSSLKKIVYPSLSRINVIFTLDRYSTIVLFSTFAVHSFK
jgi:hypothetical protein